MRKRFFVIWAASFFLFGMSGAGFATPVEYGGHYYELIGCALVDWNTANLAANSSTYTINGVTYTGHLATITNAAENQFVDNNFNNNAWLGGSKINNSWSWVTNETWSYTNWSNNESGGNFLEFCASGKWSSSADADITLHHYIVEYESTIATPLPAAVIFLGSGLVGLVGIRRKAKK